MDGQRFVIEQVDTSQRSAEADLSVPQLGRQDTELHDFLFP